MGKTENETKGGPPLTSGADPSPDRVVEGGLGMRRLTEAMRHVLRSPKKSGSTSRDSPKSVN